MSKIFNFGKLFNKNPTQTRFELITDKGNGFYVWNGKLYESDIIRSCIRPTSRAVGKSTPQHTRYDGDKLKLNPEPYIRFLLEDPNPYMTGQVLWEKTVTQLELNNNAFIYIHRDDFGYPMELYPIPATDVEAIYDNQGLLYFVFLMQNGKRIKYPYSDVIHLRQDINENDIFGESPIKSLMPLMNIVSTTDQGIVNAIKNSALIRWLLKYNTSLRPEDLTKNAKEFVDSFLSTEASMGVAAVDNKMEAKQIESKDYVPNAPQMDRTVQRLYSYFSTNEKIVQSRFNEDEWNAYYENKIEPILLQLSNEFTKKIFTRRERGFSNKIVFSASNLQYASMSTKLGLERMVDRGAMTPNEWREILGMGAIEGGEKAIRRLDTATVKTTEGGD